MSLRRAVYPAEERWRDFIVAELADHLGDRTRKGRMIRTGRYKYAAVSYTHLVLEEDTKLLDEVVVVGYGTQKKVNLTGSVATISSKDIVETHASSTSTLLAGRLPGVISMAANGFPGQGASVLILSLIHI